MHLSHKNTASEFKGSTVPQPYINIANTPTVRLLDRQNHHMSWRICWPVICVKCVGLSDSDGEAMQVMVPKQSCRGHCLCLVTSHVAVHRVQGNEQDA